MNKTVVAFLLLVIVAAGGILLFKDSQDEIETREVVAFVNGQQIYAYEVDKELATIAPQQRQSVTRLDAVDFLIEKKLLLQAAKEKNIVVSQDEIVDLYRQYADSNLFDAQLTEELIERQNLTRDEFMQRLAEQAVINKLLENVESQNFVIQNEQVEQVYELNYKDKNISFEEVEEEIVNFLIDNRKENARTAYLNNLKVSSDIILLIDS